MTDRQEDQEIVKAAEPPWVKHLREAVQDMECDCGDEHRAALAALLAVEGAARDLITNALDSSRDVELEARKRLIEALSALYTSRPAASKIEGA